MQAPNLIKKKKGIIHNICLTTTMLMHIIR
jgi:hypothetical protein